MNVIRLSIIAINGFLGSLLWFSAIAVRPAAAQADTYRGLWVGVVQLQTVNEVTLPLDADNVAVAPDPKIPTPTADRAELRLIVHVNGAGQAFLLRDVAVLNRVAGESASGVTLRAREKDLALVTDPRMYAEFPPQPAIRYASAAFDFGDAKATDALDVMVARATEAARDYVRQLGDAHFESQAARVAARDAGVTGIQPTLESMAAAADVAAAFDAFLLDFNQGAVNAVADAPEDDSVVSPYREAAETLRDASFYGDNRAFKMVAAVVAAALQAPPGRERAEARNAAAAYADVMDQYQRFISGRLFGEMMEAAAARAVEVAPGAENADAVSDILRGLPETVAAQTEALNTRMAAYGDTRAELAIDTVITEMAAAAFTAGAAPGQIIRETAEQAGRAALATMVARYPQPVQTPTLDYNAFVRSAAFDGVAGKAALAALAAAISERHLNALYTDLSLANTARIAVVNALRAEFGQAARAMRTALPLEGTFAAGAGDARFVLELAQPSDLGPAGLSGRVYLPASHPTNPFRHRRHPDHGLGYNIERMIRFDFDVIDADEVPFIQAGYGVDSLTGIYREEIFGLHKPLGPDPHANPVGLRTEGRFTLHRVSQIDTLNTR